MVMHDILVSILLGIVEGLTEFIPVSSTAHLLVTERLLGIGTGWDAFTVIIQLGAVMAVVVLYFQVFWTALVQLPSSAEARRFALGVIVAFLPAAVMGALFYRYVAGVLLNPVLAMPFIAASWIAGGVLILLFE